MKKYPSPDSNLGNHEQVYYYEIDWVNVVGRVLVCKHLFKKIRVFVLSIDLVFVSMPDK